MDNFKSVALGYRPEENQAPAILAKGAGAVGEYIRKLAEKNDVPVYRNDKLVNSLYKLKVNQEIPEELYLVVAEIFYFIKKIAEES